MIQHMLSNWVCWAIVLLALLCYQQLWEEYLNQDVMGDRCTIVADNDGVKYQFSSILIAALPLLGLLGTIIGLMNSFMEIARDGTNGVLLSGGIADALLTTQLGLVCAVPGWLLQGYVRTKAFRPSASIMSS